MLTMEFANEIIREINNVVKEKINLMNNKGEIIASTDSVRVGEIHEGAKYTIDNKIDELIVHYNGEYSGAKKGVNYLIQIQGEIIGVLGITGNYLEIIDKALIIKKLMELIIINDYNRVKKKLDETLRNKYIENWLIGNQEEEVEDFIIRGMSLGLDITIPRSFLACTIMYENSRDFSLEIVGTIEKIEDKLISLSTRKNVNNFYFRDRNAILLLGIVEIKKIKIEEYIIKLTEEVKKYQGYNIAIGIERTEKDCLKGKETYRRAKRANKASLRNDKKKYQFYEDFNMDIFSNEISTTAKNEYIAKIFKKFTDTEIKDAILLLETYYEEEGSLTKTSEKLFFHKNTIQYKLKKIEERTGYDPRSIKYASLFYNAIFFYREQSR